MAWITKEGRTVEEARDAAVAESGRPSDELEIEVVSQGAKGLFGLGGEPAVVRVRPRGEGGDVREAFQDDITPPVDDDPKPSRRERRRAAKAEEQEAEPEPEPGSDDDSDSDEDDLDMEQLRRDAQELGAEMVGGIIERMGLKGEVSAREDDDTVYIEVSGDDMGILIGRGGATLEALQELVRAGVQRKLRHRLPVVVDVENYWERRREQRGGGDGGNRGRSRSGGRRRRGGGDR